MLWFRAFEKEDQRGGDLRRSLRVRFPRKLVTASVSILQIEKKLPIAKAIVNEDNEEGLHLWASFRSEKEPGIIIDYSKINISLK